MPPSGLVINKKIIQSTMQHVVKNNFLVFMSYELGWEISGHHKEWWEDIGTGDDSCILAPRDHGKSYALAKGFPIWKAKYHSRFCKYILLLAAESTFAKKTLGELKNIIRENPRLSYLYPPSPRLYKNTSTEFELTNGVMIEAKSYLSPLRGRHPQLVILDDVLNEKNSLTDDSRNKTDRFFMEVVLPMKDKGTKKQRTAGLRSQIVVIGTAQHYKDLYHKLLANPGFRGRKQKAILDEENQIVLWPDRYSYEDLDTTRKIMGSLGFSKEYLNEPINDDTSLFPSTLFEPLLDHDLSYVSNYDGMNPVYMGVDFSVPGDSAGDYTVIATAEFDTATQTYRLLDYKRWQPTQMNDQTRAIEIDCAAYGVSMGYLEDNMFQKVYSSYFAQKNLPLKGHTVTASEKNDLAIGVLGFRPLFENSRFKFPYKTDADKAKTDIIIQEFTGLVRHNGKIANMSFHDDIVMAMWHLISASGVRTFSYEFMLDQVFPGSGHLYGTAGNKPVNRPAAQEIENVVMNDLIAEQQRMRAEAAARKARR